MFRRRISTCFASTIDRQKPEPTRDFKETVKALVDRDPEIRDKLLKEADEAIVCGDFNVATILLRDHIKATEGFEKVGEAVDKSPKILTRMFGPAGNPM